MEKGCRKIEKQKTKANQSFVLEYILAVLYSRNKPVYQFVPLGRVKLPRTIGAPAFNFERRHVVSKSFRKGEL
jgi:hypothetical protein